MQYLPRSRSITRDFNSRQQAAAGGYRYAILVCTPHTVSLLVFTPPVACFAWLCAHRYGVSEWLVYLPEDVVRATTTVVSIY
jgi:hypothetical protein